MKIGLADKITKIIDDNYLRFMKDGSGFIHKYNAFLNGIFRDTDNVGDINEGLKLQDTPSLIIGSLIFGMVPIFLNGQNPIHIDFANRFSLPLSELIFGNNINFPNRQAIQIWYSRYLTKDIATPYSLNSNLIN